MYKSYRNKANGRDSGQKAANAFVQAQNTDIEYSGLSDEEIRQVCSEPDSATVGSYITQTNYRVKDPRRSLEFYTGALGLRLLKRIDFSSMAFSVFFLGYEDIQDIPTEAGPEQMIWLFSRKAVLSLTHNWGSEDEDTFEISNGNSNPKGYGHIGICVPDVDEACERLQQRGVTFLKQPNDGNLKGLAFIQDPDGYWIEILNPNNMAKLDAAFKAMK